MEAIVYIYMKDSRIRAMSSEEARTWENRFLIDGWKHVATIDAADFIEVLCNDHEDKDFRKKFINYLIK